MVCHVYIRWAGYLLNILVLSSAQQYSNNNNQYNSYPNNGYNDQRYQSNKQSSNDQRFETYNRFNSNPQNSNNRQYQSNPSEPRGYENTNLPNNYKNTYQSPRVNKGRSFGAMNNKNDYSFIKPMLEHQREAIIQMENIIATKFGSTLPRETALPPVEYPRNPPAYVNPISSNLQGQIVNSNQFQRPTSPTTTVSFVSPPNPSPLWNTRNITRQDAPYQQNFKTQPIQNFQGSPAQNFQNPPPQNFQNNPIPPVYQFNSPTPIQKYQPPPPKNVQDSKQTLLLNSQNNPSQQVQNYQTFTTPRPFQTFSAPYQTIPKYSPPPQNMANVPPSTFQNYQSNPTTSGIAPQNFPIIPSQNAQRHSPQPQKDQNSIYQNMSPPSQSVQAPTSSNFQNYLPPQNPPKNPPIYSPPQQNVQNYSPPTQTVPSYTPPITEKNPAQYIFPQNFQNNAPPQNVNNYSSNNYSPPPKYQENYSPSNQNGLNQFPQNYPISTQNFQTTPPPVLQNYMPPTFVQNYSSTPQNIQTPIGQFSQPAQNNSQIPENSQNYTFPQQTVTSYTPITEKFPAQALQNFQNNAPPQNVNNYSSPNYSPPQKNQENYSPLNQNAPDKFNQNSQNYLPSQNVNNFSDQFPQNYPMSAQNFQTTPAPAFQNYQNIPPTFVQNYSSAPQNIQTPVGQFTQPSQNYSLIQENYSFPQQNVPNYLTTTQGYTPPITEKNQSQFPQNFQNYSAPIQNFQIYPTSTQNIQTSSGQFPQNAQNHSPLPENNQIPNVQAFPYEPKINLQNSQPSQYQNPSNPNFTFAPNTYQKPMSVPIRKRPHLKEEDEIDIEEDEDLVSVTDPPKPLPKDTYKQSKKHRKSTTPAPNTVTSTNASTNVGTSNSGPERIKTSTFPPITLQNVDDEVPEFAEWAHTKFSESLTTTPPLSRPPGTEKVHQTSSGSDPWDTPEITAPLPKFEKPNTTTPSPTQLTTTTKFVTPLVILETGSDPWDTPEILGPTPNFTNKGAIYQESFLTATEKPTVAPVKAEAGFGPQPVVEKPTVAPVKVEPVVETITTTTTQPSKSKAVPMYILRIMCKKTPNSPKCKKNSNSSKSGSKPTKNPLIGNNKERLDELIKQRNEANSTPASSGGGGDVVYEADENDEESGGGSQTKPPPKEDEDDDGRMDEAQFIKPKPKPKP